MFEGLGIGLRASISGVAPCVWHTSGKRTLRFRLCLGSQVLR